MATVVIRMPRIPHAVSADADRGKLAIALGLIVAPRRPGEPGIVGNDGAVRYRSLGSLRPRVAAPGVRLAKDEWRSKDFDAFEDML